MEYRRWLTFSIRDLFWLTVVAAMAAGWYAHHRSVEAKHAAKVVEIDARWERIFKEVGDRFSRESNELIEDGSRQVESHMKRMQTLQDLLAKERKAWAAERAELVKAAEK